MGINYKAKDTNGHLINRCNRCGTKLNPQYKYFSGKEPICYRCYTKLWKEPGQGKSNVKRTLLLKHRQDYYEKAINDFFDGKVTMEYVRERWKKLKQIK